MNQLNLKNKKVTVMGLGLHGGGVGTTCFLVKQGAQVTVTDLKSEKELAPALKKLKGLPIKLVLGGHKEDDFINPDLVIKNPAVPSDSPFLKIAQAHKIPIDTDMGLFWRLCPSRNIIGVTGTKGKSTTTALIYQMLKQENKETQIAGNIRISPFEGLDKIKKDTPVVLELSSWQLEGLALHKISPHIACITNIFPDHLNRYKSLNEYAEAKKNIFKFQKAQDYVIMNYDNPILRNPRFCLNLKNIYWFSRREKVGKGAFLRGSSIIFIEKNLEHRLASVSDLKLPGEHNLENALAAITCASVWGVKRTPIQKVLKNFKGLEGRLELVREFKGVKYYNDTTSTTPTSTLAGLNSFQEPVILIAGGAEKNLDFSSLAQIIIQKVKALILLSGEATPKLLQEVKKYLVQVKGSPRNRRFRGVKVRRLEPTKRKLPITTTQSMAEAVKKARFFACPGDIVLLSPACASFGMFQNEFERGEKFNQAVQKLK